MASSHLRSGGNHSCALHDGGSVACWGSNSAGQLGNRGTADSNVPIEVADLSDAAAITAGGNHTCAVRKNGEMLCWGDNASGQLGDGSTTDRSAPVKVHGLILSTTAGDQIDATAIDAGDSHTCARYPDGYVTCWGDNNHDQLGKGHPSPFSVLESIN